MRRIEYSSSFKKDYKRESKGKYQKELDAQLKLVLSLLVTDQSIEQKYRDHVLSGNWSGYRECHIWPDLLLIYSKTDHTILKLARLGSHSNLFN